MKNYRPSVERNPFMPGVFWGRQRELKDIYHHLQSSPPQSCALIGETYSGKTALLRRLLNARDPLLADELAIRKKITFAYLDCIAYNDPEVARKGAYASVLFWWELYSEIYTKVQPTTRPKLSRPGDFRDEDRQLEIAFELKFELEELIRNHIRQIVIMLDNFEGVARLPRRNSHWLRSLCQLSCTLIAASRDLLYLTYPYDARNQQDYSPLWNLFSDPIYLGLMDDDEVTSFLQDAYEQARKQESSWRPEDIDFIRSQAGRHPELLRIVCMHMFEYRTLPPEEQGPELLNSNIMRDTRPICIQLWKGLNDSALNSELPLSYYRTRTELENQQLTPYQAALLDVTHEREIEESNALLILDQRGLIDYTDGKWKVFSGIMERFILDEERKLNLASAPSLVRGGEQRNPLVFSYLEGKVYDYLYSRLGEVCDRDEIKHAVWPTGAPGNSALQKIIERVREKIERDGDPSLYLIAVRRRGYMLRYGPLENEPERGLLK